MDGSAHYRKAEELAEKAHAYLGHGDGQESAAVWAAVAQVHATLALAAAHNPDYGEISGMRPNVSSGMIPDSDEERTRQMIRDNPLP